ncbi:uncharacterized protein [Zea mays]|uniref:uncharacterized protein n=1 Tax=Zea mays TaxID=4577 RepID=UPI0009AA0A5B|nr:uncharacterized protein LOC109941173 [Zea mays]|eukprot:XP_020397275.1 uncharacterized protein LOC109941173 [Zea mays]
MRAVSPPRITPPPSSNRASTPSSRRLLPPSSAHRPAASCPPPPHEPQPAPADRVRALSPLLPLPLSVHDWVGYRCPTQGAENFADICAGEERPPDQPVPSECAQGGAGVVRADPVPAGAGAPVGSFIVGSKAFIDKAKILRKTLGGGMRQVGVLCAAAHVAVRDNVGKLADDHRKAKALADGLNKIEQFRVDSASVQTNMVFLDIVDSRISSNKLCQVLGTHNVLASPRSPKR